MKKVFITRRLPEIAFTLLGNYFKVDASMINEPLPRVRLKEIVKEYDAILTTVSEKIDKDILSEKMRLSVISNYASGLDNIDLNLAQKFGVAVYNTPDIVTDSTADLTIGLIISMCRMIQNSNKFIKEGKWQNWDPEIFLGTELRNRTIGIIGFGKVGQAVAKRLISFGCNVIFTDNRTADIPPELIDRVSFVDLKYLLENSEIISIHVSLNNETKHLINSEAFFKMTKRPYLINMSRGGVVDTDSLLNALRNNKLRGVALDVTDPEPLPFDHALLSFDNCLITPHIGTATEECRSNMALLAAQNIVNHFYPQKIKSFYDK